MVCDLMALFEEVDVRISTNPGLTLKPLARELGIDRRAVEEAVYRSGSGGFCEYKSYRGYCTR
jgi:hypothetical protein